MTLLLPFSVPWLDSQKLLGVAVVAGTVLTVGFLLLGGFFRGLSKSVQLALYVFAVLLPPVGIGLIGLGGYWLLKGAERTDSQIAPKIPASGTTAASEAVGEDIEHSLASAATNRYRCRQHSSGQRVEEVLRAGAVRKVRTREGHDYDTARSIVAAGDWTEDPVAAAFLSSQTPYPLGERVRGALDPGAAYWRRVDRTLDAIDGETAAQPSADTGATQEVSR